MIDVPSASLASRLRDRLYALVTLDFSPRFSAKVRRLVGRPLAILLLAGIVALLCGLFLHAQGFVLCGGVMAVVALGVIWPWLSLRGLAGTLAFDRSQASEGDVPTSWPRWVMTTAQTIPMTGSSQSHPGQDTGTAGQGRSRVHPGPTPQLARPLTLGAEPESADAFTPDWSVA
ncbi:MAG: hypothetical protein C0467_31035 [Planctomycetaceae bacterium]|nr:hypothetical protein [Planctomycetaceae bacterium]